jgi:hypothetical protein
MRFKTVMGISASVLLTAGLAMSVEPNTRTFTAGQKEKVHGVIVSREGDTLKVRGDDDSIGTIDLADNTKIQLKHGILWHKSDTRSDSLVPGLYIKVHKSAGKGERKGRPGSRWSRFRSEFDKGVTTSGCAHRAGGGAHGRVGRACRPTREPDRTTGNARGPAGRSREADATAGGPGTD